jgi:hypothetical protein
MKLRALTRYSYGNRALSAGDTFEANDATALSSCSSATRSACRSPGGKRSSRPTNRRHPSSNRTPNRPRSRVSAATCGVTNVRRTERGALPAPPEPIR